MASSNQPKTLPVQREFWSKLRSRLLLILHHIISSPDLPGVFLILSVAFIFRFVNLEGWPRWYVDESIYGEAGRNLYQGIVGIKGSDPGPGAHFFLIISGFLTILFGNQIIVIRLISVVFGSLSCVLTYFVGKQLYGSSAGLIAGLFLAISYNAVYLDRLGFNTAMFDFFVVLTLLCYLIASKMQKGGWTYALGLSGGAAIATKIPQGGFGLIFPIIMSFVEKKSRIFLRALPLIMWGLFMYLIISLVTNFVLYWKVFLFIGQGQSLWSTDYWPMLRVFLMASPSDQLSNQEGMFHIGLWATLGFVSLIYAASKRNRSDLVVLVAFFSILLTILVLKVSVWWILLIGILPLYALASGQLLSDFLFKKTERLLILPFILLLGLSEWSFANPTPYGFKPTSAWMGFINITSPETIIRYSGIFLFLLSTVALRSPEVVLKLWKRKIIFSIEKTNRVIAVAFLVLVVGLNLQPLITSIARDDTLDQREIIQWINKEIKPGELIGTSLSLLYLIDSKIQAMDLEYIFYYNYHIAGPRYSEFRPMKIDTPLDQVKYIVFDHSFVGAAPIFLSFVQEISSLWNLVYTVGDFKVYQNPEGLNVTPLKEIFSDKVVGRWRVVDGGSLDSIKVINSSLIPDTPTEFNKIAELTYDKSRSGVTRFRFTMSEPFNLQNISSTGYYLEMWLYGDGSALPIEGAWRDVNGLWKLLEEEAIFAEILWNGWRVFRLPYNLSAPEQEGFNINAVAGFEVNIQLKRGGNGISTLYIGPVTIVRREFVY